VAGFIVPAPTSIVGLPEHTAALRPELLESKNHLLKIERHGDWRSVIRDERLVVKYAGGQDQARGLYRTEKTMDDRPLIIVRITLYEMIGMDIISRVFVQTIGDVQKTQSGQG
jgi:hypothetical protein